ncbi:MAG: hypothetical protein QW303_01245 [Nitrososphaerota archaeon]
MTRSGKRYKFKELEFWAADGMVAVLDTKKAGGDQLSVENATVWLTPKDFLRRALGAFVLHRHFSVTEARRLLDDAQTCAKEAYVQGNPLDEKVFRQKMEDARKIQISTTGIIVPFAQPRRDPLYESYVRELKQLERRNDKTAEEVLLKGY